MGLITRFKISWRELRRGDPGRRFRERYERRHKRSHPNGRKWSAIIFGALIVLAGIVLLPLPGPGMLVIAAGALLMAEESLAIARALDAIEVRARNLLGRRTRWQRSGNR
jgi:hypothetical protein